MSFKEAAAERWGKLLAVVGIAVITTNALLENSDEILRGKNRLEIDEKLKENKSAVRAGVFKTGLVLAAMVIASRINEANIQALTAIYMATSVADAAFGGWRMKVIERRVKDRLEKKRS